MAIQSFFHSIVMRHHKATSFTTHHLCCDNSQHHKSIARSTQSRRRNVLFCLTEIFMSAEIDEWRMNAKRKRKVIVKLLILRRALYLSYHISHASVITTMCHAIITSLSTYKTFNVSFFLSPPSRMAFANKR